MNCQETTFLNHNHVWLWIQIHWTAWCSAIHSWPKMRKCDQHSTNFYIWTTVSCSTNTNFHWWKLLFPRASAPIQILNFWVCFCSTRFYECPYGDLIWRWISLTSFRRVNGDRPQQVRVDWDVNFLSNFQDFWFNVSVSSNCRNTWNF